MNHQIFMPKGWVNYLPKSVGHSLRNNQITLINTYGVIDQLTYHLFGNKLTRVDDSGEADKGFRNGADVENEYSHDVNGNLDRDMNKNITSIKYNYLNLPEEIEWNNGNKIQNTYSADGVKRKQKTIEGTAEKERFYNGQFLYEDDALHTIFTSEGRIVNYAATENFLPTDTWDSDYQYHLKDHLGNVRVTFSSLRGSESLEYLADMEYSQSGSNDEDLFENMHLVHLDSAYNHTAGGSSSVYLYSDTLIVGPAIVLPVNKGDTIRIEAWARYLYLTGQNTSLPSLITALTGAFGGVNGGTEAQQQVYDLLSAPVGSVGLLGDSGNDEVPNATMNYLFFDENMNFVNTLGKGFDFTAITDAAENAWEQLTLEKVADRKGFIYIYVANETPGDKVWFDDLRITHIEHPVVQYDDYGIAGDRIKSYYSGVHNKYLYQGKEIISDLDLDIFDFGWRGYDPKIMRTWQIDPMARKFYPHSPYSWALNNPLRFIDPDGREARPLDGVVTFSGYVGDDGTGRFSGTQIGTGDKKGKSGDKDTKKAVEKDRKKRIARNERDFWTKVVNWLLAQFDIPLTLSFKEKEDSEQNNEKQNEKATVDIDGLIDDSGGGSAVDNAPESTGNNKIMGDDGTDDFEHKRKVTLEGSENSGDSVVTFFPSDKVPTLRAVDKNGNFSPGGRPITDKEDSAKYKWKLGRIIWKGYNK